MSTSFISHFKNLRVMSFLLIILRLLSLLKTAERWYMTRAQHMSLGLVGMKPEFPAERDALIDAFENAYRAGKKKLLWH